MMTRQRAGRSEGAAKLNPETKSSRPDQFPARIIHECRSEAAETDGRREKICHLVHPLALPHGS